MKRMDIQIPHKEKDPYYIEEAPSRRREILYAQKGQETGAENQERYRLKERMFQSRYKDFDGTDDTVDYYLKLYMELKYLQNQSGFFIKRRVQNTCREAAEVFCLEELKRRPSCRDLWYSEFCHLVRTYLKTCFTDQNYGAVMCGVGRISDDSFSRRVSQDLLGLAEYVRELSARAEGLDLLEQAIRDSLKVMMA